MDILNEIKKGIEESCSVKNSVEKEVIERLIKEIIECFKRGGKLIFFGNGGSAADAQHLAAEFIVRFKKNRSSLAAIALTTDTSVLTAIANDFAFTQIFKRQLEGLLKKEDIVIGLSTSGKSQNVIEALEYARGLGVLTVGFVGCDGGKMKDLCDILIWVKSCNTPRIQEAHMTIGHIVCELVENLLF